MKTVYALGFFDGVHAGHKRLLDACREIAAGMGAEPGVLTFENHPDALVFGKNPGLINTNADRDALLREAGMEAVVSLPFTRELMAMPWQDFYRMARDTYGGCGFVCGEDFTFGAKGQGTALLLSEICRREGIPCHIIPQEKIDGKVVSSTYIRSLMTQGRVEEMTAFLGHPHFLSGVVLPGKQLGRTIGIPTANIAYPKNLQKLRLGVYATHVLAEGKTYAAVTNVGSRPTVGGESVNVESWLLDFDGNLYGKRIAVFFHAFLRPEKKFSSLSEMQEEIQKNAAQTRKIFKI